MTRRTNPSTTAALRAAWLSFTAATMLGAIPAFADDRPVFEARALLVLSDGDMLAAAYAGAALGESVGDALSFVDVSGGLEAPRVTRIGVSNGVPGAPGALAVSIDARFAYVAESRSSPGEGAQTFRDLAPGRLLQAVDTADPTAMRVIDTLALPREPDTVSLSPNGDWLAVALSGDRTRTPGEQLALVPLRPDGTFGDPSFFALPGVDPTNFARQFVFHPTRMSFAALLSEHDEVRFFNNVERDGAIAIEAWGNTVGTGKFPYTGRFSPDGRYFVIAEVQWGRDVPGRGAESPVGGVALIRLGVDAPEGGDAALDGRAGRVFVPIRDQGLHARVSFVEALVNPEGLEISPDGRFVIATSIDQSWLPSDDPRYTPYATATLIELDAERSRLVHHDDVFFYGQLPEGAAFDATSRNLFIASYADPSNSLGDGALHHFRIVDTPRGLRLAPTDIRIAAPRGAHFMTVLH